MSMISSVHAVQTPPGLSRQIMSGLESKGSESTRKTIERNATDYTSYLMSTFAKTLLETGQKPENLDQELMGTSFLSEALGEAMVTSGVGEAIRQDLLESMLTMQGVNQPSRSMPPEGYLTQQEGLSSLPLDQKGDLK
tara:strand:- start:2698 stop:3111 length:414 start_codon:yes stop_codon:yes gene_type:complete